MAVLNFTQAAAMAGISRVTLHKHIKSGKVSISDDSGCKGIDTAELLRVYGSFDKGIVNSSVHDTHPLHDALQRENDALRGELALLRELLSAREAHIQSLHELNRVLQPVKQIAWLSILKTKLW